MSLPKITVPHYAFVIPSTGKKIEYRPMLVKEEKILLMAKQSNLYTDLISSIKQVVQSCIVSEGISVSALTKFDVELLFCKIRAASISDIVEVSYRDSEDDKVYEFKIDLNAITVRSGDKELIAGASGSSEMFKLSDELALTLKYPSVSLYEDSELVTSTDAEAFSKVLVACCDKLFQGDQTIDLKSTDAKEVTEFIDSIPSKSFVEIQKWIDSIPTLYYKIEYQNSKGTKREIVLRTLTDFFSFG